jgi:hypothetical protein
MRDRVKRIPPGNAIAVVALVLAMGGAAYAGSQIDTRDLARSAVTAQKLAKNAVSTPKIRKDAVTGEKVDESTLGAVPSVAGRIPFFQPLTSGQSVEIAHHGLITLTASCATVGETDQVSITARTAQDGAVMDGTDDHEGGGTSTFLDVSTPADQSELVYNSTPRGIPSVDNDTDEGFVIGPDGKGFSIAGDEARLALNYLNLPCFVSGVLTQIG